MKIQQYVYVWPDRLAHGLYAGRALVHKPAPIQNMYLLERAELHGPEPARHHVAGALRQFIGRAAMRTGVHADAVARIAAQ